jgi:hypothetical protein
MVKKSKSPLSIGAGLASLSGLAVQGAEAKIAVVNDNASTAAKQARAVSLPSISDQSARQRSGEATTPEGSFRPSLGLRHLPGPAETTLAQSSNQLDLY